MSVDSNFAEIYKSNSKLINNEILQLLISVDPEEVRVLIDEIIKEMPGGAHRYPNEQFLLVKKTIIANLEELTKLPVEKIVAKRNEKFLNITHN